MSRPTLLLASSHPCTLAALRRLVDLAVPGDALPHEVEPLPFSCAADLFARLEAMPPERLRETMLVLDLIHDPAGAWDVADLRQAGLATRLLLSYPEVYCVVWGSPTPLWGVVQGATEAEEALIKCHHFVTPGQATELFELVRLHAQGFQTLFDPTGLRALLKGALFEAVGGKRARVYGPLVASRRRHVAAVADEELPFVALNGYLAYKAGLRAWCVSTEAEYDRLLQKGIPVAERRPGPTTFAVLMSDWDLVFPDHQGPRPEESDHETNSLLLGKLPVRPKSLILVTGFGGKKQQRFLKERKGARASKPYGGFFDLLACGGRGGNVLRQRYSVVWGDIRARARADQGASQQTDAHTVPFARGAVANCLLRRARRLGSEGRKDTESWVQVALLCAEAKEILGGLSRTTAYEAVALQNEAEVVAEISFFGTLAQSKVAERLADLERETDIVQRVSGGGRGKAERESRTAQLNCLLQAANTLRRHFSDHQQIEASEECLRKITEYHHRLERPTFGPLTAAAGWVLRGMRGLRRVIAAWLPSVSWVADWYPSFATRAGTSLFRLFWVSVLWVLLFGVAYAGLLAHHYGASAGLGLWHSCLTFVLQPSVSQIEQDFGAYQTLRDCGGYRAALLAELVIAYLHLGLLLSVLYRRVTLRAP